MKLSHTTMYALQAVLQLAAYPPQQPVPCRQIAAGKMPERFLLQILRTLVTKGLLKSIRGVDGGYFLQRSVDQISLLDVIEAVEGPLGSKLRNDNLPQAVATKLDAALSQCTEALRKKLAQVKLGGLLSGSNR